MIEIVRSTVNIFNRALTADEIKELAKLPEEISKVELQALYDECLTLKEENGEISYYKVEENRVRLLTDDKQEITGALADHYILNKE